MPRRMLTDEQWSKIQTIMLKDRVYNKPEHRHTLEGILYRMRTGCPWRDLPEVFGERHLANMKGWVKAEVAIRPRFI